MQSHATGCFKGNRLGTYRVQQSWLFATGLNGLVSGLNQKLCTIAAATLNPILYTVRLIEIAANTASGAVTASVGTASAGTQLLNAVSLKATAGTNYVPTQAFVYSEADVDIWLNFTVASGTDAASKFVVIVEAHEVNLTAINTLEA